MENYKTTGFLFYKKEENNLYFLLGKDPYTGKYSHFYGIKEMDDNNISDTAVKSTFDQTMGSLYNKKELNNLLTSSTSYYNDKLQDHMFAVNSNIKNEELNVFNNTTKYLISKKYSVKKIDIKWFKLDEILNFTDYFDKSFLRTFLKFLKTSEL